MFKSFSSLLFLLLALSLAIHGIEGTASSFSFSVADASSDIYQSFIKALRAQLSTGSDTVYNATVLHQSVPDSKRFILIDLSNSDNETITVAIDVLDVKLVAYLTGSKSYFFPDAPELAFQSLFSETHKNNLNFSSAYHYIENAAGTTRLETPIGLAPLSSAIGNLFHYRSKLVPSSMLVVMQMISEASKFRYIEHSVRKSIKDEKEFTPSLAIVSLEDNWSWISAQIQGSVTLQGLLPNTVKLIDSKNQTIEVDSIYYPIIIPNIALQHYRCHFSTRNGKEAMPKLIRMLGDGVDNDPCEVLERTSRISGRDGKCVDVRDSKTFDGNEIILYECGTQKNQIFTFYRDGTIKYSGKCKATNSSSESANLANSVVIYNCSLAGPEATNWKLSPDGTINNPSSGLVLTADSGEERTLLKVKDNTYTAGQGWRAGDNVKPIVTSIIGYKDLCLEATGSNYTNMSMEECVKDKEGQEWALYSDGTIRLNSNRNLCVTALGNNDGDLVVPSKCNGSSEQRWVFLANGKILNPSSELVMDVRYSNVDLKQIIVYIPTRNNNQLWLPYY